MRTGSSSGTRAVAWRGAARAGGTEGEGRRGRAGSGPGVRAGKGAGPGGARGEQERGRGGRKEGGREKKKEKEKRGKRNGKKEKEIEEKKMGGRERKKEGKGGEGRCVPAATAAAVGHAWRRHAGAGHGGRGTLPGGKEEKEGAGFAAAGHDASRWMRKRWDVD